MSLPTEVVQLITSYLTLPRLEILIREVLQQRSDISEDYIELRVPHEEFLENFSPDNDTITLLLSSGMTYHKMTYHKVGELQATVECEMLGFFDEGEARLSVEEFRGVPDFDNTFERQIYLIGRYLDRVLTDAEGTFERMRPASPAEIAQALSRMVLE